MTNQEKSEKKDWARLLFIHEKMTQKEIAEKVGTSEVTISAWVKAENWGKLKTSLVMTRQEELARLYTQIAELNAVIEAREDRKYAFSDEADVLSKLTAAIKKLETEITISEVINVFINFNDFARASLTSDEMRKFTTVQDAFIRQKLSAQ